MSGIVALLNQDGTAHRSRPAGQPHDLRVAFAALIAPALGLKVRLGWATRFW